VDTPHEPQRGRIIAFPQPPHAGDAPGDDRVIAQQPAREGAATPPIAHLRALPLGISSGAFYPHVPTEEVPARAAALGISTVELMLQTAGEYDPAFVADLAARVADAGVAVRSVHTLHRLHPLFDAYARRAREGRELFQRGIEAAATLGAEVLVWHGARSGEVREQEGWDRFVEATGELAAACAAAGVTLGLENVSWCALATVRDVVRMATTMEEIAPAAHLGFVFDPFQAMRAEANPFMVLAAMGNRLVNVHISDFSEDAPDRHHLPPGEGAIPWSALLRAIAGGGDRGPLILESPLTEGAATLDTVRAYLEPRIRSIFDHAPDAATRPAPPLPEPATMPDGLRQGIALFNRRRYFEAHEVIEHEWHAERGPIRRLYQGILQIGVGFYHALNGNHKGALLLLGDGIAKTSNFVPEALGIDTGRLVAEARVCLEAIAALGPDELARFDTTSIPRIHGPGVDSVEDR
jgi:sugar phosphate isomerase/epimerase